MLLGDVFALCRCRRREPALVWREVQTHIKGSLAAVLPEAWGGGGGRLSQEAYVGMADSRAGANLSAEQRECIYKLFK